VINGGEVAKATSKVLDGDDRVHGGW
jgi:hypothetical protein